MYEPENETKKTKQRRATPNVPTNQSVVDIELTAHCARDDKIEKNSDVCRGPPLSIRSGSKKKRFDLRVSE